MGSLWENLVYGLVICGVPLILILAILVFTNYYWTSKGGHG